MTKAKSFTPEWTSPPGDTIADRLEELGWTGADLAERLGVTPKHVSELLHGKAPISAETAGRLSFVLGSSAEFWMNREARYRAALERQQTSRELLEQAGWLSELPLRWMIRQRWVEGCKDKARQVEVCLRWFGVASVEAWRATYAEPLAAWRASDRLEKKPGAVATWLRRAEIAAGELQCAPFDRAGFLQSLQELRQLTAIQDPALFLPRLRSLCAAHGVAVVFVPAPPGCPISGATRWLTPEKALLSLSLRYRTNDHLWFSFFHEAAHLIKHGKKLLFIEGFNGLDAEKEAEANRFAADLLIPPSFVQSIRDLKTAEQVVAHAQEIGVAPGILVGRLQHEGWLPRSHLNQLKVRYTWADEESHV